MPHRFAVVALLAAAMAPTAAWVPVSRRAERAVPGCVQARTTAHPEEDEPAQESSTRPAGGSITTRRGAVSTALATALATAVRPSGAEAKDANVQSPRMRAYEVLERDPPALQPFKPKGEKRVIKMLAKQSSAIFVGDHPSSARDHVFEADLLRRLAEARRGPWTLALATFPTSLQPAFDRFMDRASDSDAEAEVQLRLACADVLDRELVEVHLPVLRLARSLKLCRLMAAGMSSEVLTRVRAEGLEKIERSEIGQYVDSAAGFVETVQQPGFKVYSDWAVQDLYEKSVGSGEISADTVSLVNFFAGEILLHEAIAKRVADRLREAPDELVVTLLDLDRVKFGMGASTRLTRMGRPEGADVPADAPSTFAVETIAINPTAADSITPMKSLRLKLGYGRDQLKITDPLARYLWFSYSPPPYLLTHMLNEIE